VNNVTIAWSMASFLSLSPVLLPDFYLAAVEENWRMRLCIPAISIDEGKNATLTFITNERATPYTHCDRFFAKRWQCYEVKKTNFAR